MKEDLALGACMISPRHYLQNFFGIFAPRILYGGIYEQQVIEKASFCGSAMEEGSLCFEEDVVEQASDGS